MKRIKQIFVLPEIGGHFLVIWCLLLALIMDYGVGYRSLGYVNILFIVYGLIKSNYVRYKVLSCKAYLILVPFIFFFFHCIATMSFSISSEFNQFILVIFFVYGLYIVSSQYKKYIQENYLSWVSFLIFCFLAVQLTHIVLINHIWGTFNNPHYLAINSALLIPVIVFLIAKTKKKNIFNTLFLYLCLVVLAGLVLYTSSRPTWIGLILSGIFTVCYLELGQKTQASSLLITIITLLFITNIESFSSRLKDLFMNITVEERVTIWLDAWRMQKTSNLKHWLIGHGMQSYENDFMLFSTYQAQGVSFGSPHNWILEVLYLSGVIGLIVFVFIYVYTFLKLMYLIKHSVIYKDISLMLASMLIVSIVMGFLTVKIFSHYTVFQLAFVMGLAIFLRDNSQNINIR
jgi:O-antigen ligase